MGTEVLRSQDCLARSSPAFRNPNHRACRKPGYGGRPDTRRRREDAAPRSSKGSARQHLVNKRGKPQEPAVTFGAGSRPGPDPNEIPKEVSTRRGAAVAGRVSDAYAGAAILLSPSPRALPLPSFSRKGKAAAAEDAVTRELRRLLRLE